MGRHCVDAAFALHTLPSWVRISLLLPDFRAQCPEEQRCCLESEQHSACLEEKSLFLQCRDLFSSFLFSLGYLPSAQHVESITAAEWSRICFLCERTNERTNGGNFEEENSNSSTSSPIQFGAKVFAKKRHLPTTFLALCCRTRE